MLRLTRAEREQARAYRKMIRRARARSRCTLNPGAPLPADLYTKRGRLIAREHKRAISKLFCVATAIRHGIEVYRVHVAHVRFSCAKAGVRSPGLQRKPDDRWTLPLFPEEHRLQHAMNEAAYWAELNLDPHTLARRLYEASPDQEAMTAVLREAVAAGPGGHARASGQAERDQAPGRAARRSAHA